MSSNAFGTSLGTAFDLTTAGLTSSDIQTAAAYWTCPGYTGFIPIFQIGGSGGVEVTMPLSGASPVAATQELVRTGLVKPPEKPADEAFWKTFWKLPRAEFVRPRDQEEEERAEGWELREAV